jgi:hypothetical protein
MRMKKNHNFKQHKARFNEEYARIGSSVSEAERMQQFLVTLPIKVQKASLESAIGFQPDSWALFLQACQTFWGLECGPKYEQRMHDQRHQKKTVGLVCNKAATALYSIDEADSDEDSEWSVDEQPIKKSKKWDDDDEAVEEDEVPTSRKRKETKGKKAEASAEDSIRCRRHRHHCDRRHRCAGDH